MRRREFLAGIGGIAASSIAARAQQPTRLPIVGFMGAATPSAWTPWTTAFVRRLDELGWVDGKTVRIEYRWAAGSEERYAEIGAELVNLDAKVLVTVGGDAARKATSKTPVVVALMSDPVGTGLVSSLARPGGNITGMSIQSTDLAGKRIELLKEAIPAIRNLGILAYVDYAGTMLDVGAIHAASKSFGLEVVTVPIHRASDIEPALASLDPQTQAIYVPPNLLVNTNRVLINELAQRKRLPTMYGFREYVDSGGLTSYGPNTPYLFRRAADYVDKILRGAKPNDLPVEQPTKFDLIVNLKVAKLIGLELSPSFLARADGVIE
ncbi:ABC transporter substrate-binding protein [Bradyrhizobium sp. dw_411]|uniref:ABC transporter substrate-binding protein n=1 Tax=Bradyrhizobium sp. dw_411 TaxID=2720082 RepID=UPI001BD00F8E|nr:ABC transporter substrate-binding protein [Bradyrhizobium sp. dw_411]